MEEQVVTPLPLWFLGANISHMDHLSAALGKSLFFLFISFIVLLKDVLKVCSVCYLVVILVRILLFGRYFGPDLERYSVCRGEAMSCGLGSPLSHSTEFLPPSPSTVGRSWLI